MKVEGIELLGEEEPKIIKSRDISNLMYELRTQHFIVLGNSNFVGPESSLKNLRDDINKQTKKIRATHAIYARYYLRDKYSEGSSYGWYDYNIYYLVKWPRETSLGVLYSDLEVSDRERIGRNTGVIINVVYMGTPAFFADLQRGDVIIKANEVVIREIKDLARAIDLVSKDSAVDEYEVVFIRDGKKISTMVKKI